jgi:hypothetical protein
MANPAPDGALEPPVPALKTNVFVAADVMVRFIPLKFIKLLLTPEN